MRGMEDGGYYGSHELHVTTDPLTTDPELFRRTCGRLGVKAHVIYNETPQGETIVDYLTGSQHICRTDTAFAALAQISNGLTRAGLTVVREKIESAPFHPMAPQSPLDTMQPGSYFESHFTLPDLPTTHGWKLLRWRDVPFLISTTEKKRQAGLLFATIRHYISTAADFCQSMDELHAALSEQIDVEKPVVEFSVYDSNPDHDKAWVDSYLPFAGTVVVPEV